MRVRRRVPISRMHYRAGASVTKNSPVSEDLARFLHRETLAFTMIGALSRNKLYRNSISDNRRREFRDSLRCWLDDKVGEYKEEVDECRHLSNIENLSSELSKSHKDILSDEGFHIGAAQKMLNLYLKYCWARGVVREPPHCPIDSIVLKEVKYTICDAKCQMCRELTWTKIRCVDQYMHVVKNAKARAKKERLSLACWELKIWEEVQKRSS